MDAVRGSRVVLLGYGWGRERLILRRGLSLHSRVDEGLEGGKGCEDVVVLLWCWEGKSGWMWRGIGIDTCEARFRSVGRWLWLWLFYSV